MSEEIISKNDIKERIQKLQDFLCDTGLDGSLIIQRADLLYYTGISFQGALVVPAKGDSRIYVWRGYGKFDDNFPIEYHNVLGLSGLTTSLSESEFAKWTEIGLEEDVLPVAIFKRLFLKTWSVGNFHDISTQIRNQRSVKSEIELKWIRASGKTLVKGFEALPGIICEGMPEYEIQAQMDVILRREGDQSYVRARAFNSEAIGVVAFGASGAGDNALDGPICQPGRSSFAQMGGGDRVVKPDFPLAVDVTTAVNGYTTDMTRCYSLGKLDSRFTDAHNFCVKLIEDIFAKMIPGAIPEEIYFWALNEAKTAGYEDVFMNSGYNKVRFLGHGIGIELDEWPVLAKRFTEPMKEGMVVAIEPKIIFQDGTVGVEDTVIVKEGGAEVVTGMKREIIQL
ncbi:MAG: Xaa-Pro peptidase family protein [Candidatus Electryonea clarkiae]|nr:Xaa-Pro peptidase family protein [Candidatus Electryonea clarkiae]MDP8288074.1 Xaa-Pro peptidase family protein [Candidatus Electryonea clarkiae]